MTQYMAGAAVNEVLRMPGGNFLTARRSGRVIDAGSAMRARQAANRSGIALM
jgi:hypothetical protein